MSLPDVSRLARAAAALAMCVGLSACFRPLYGPTASGEPLRASLAAIEIDEVGVAPTFERFGHYLRSELAFDLNGSGVPAPKRYKLALAFTSTLTTPIVDTQSGRAQSATINGTVTYTLTNADRSQTLTSCRATGTVSYDRNPQRFASLRAGRDAEIRLAKVLADQIRTRLSIALANRT
jgi:LPS-assembly lipoprotein